MHLSAVQTNTLITGAGSNEKDVLVYSYGVVGSEPVKQHTHHAWRNACREAACREAWAYGMLLPPFGIARSSVRSDASDKAYMANLMQFLCSLCLHSNKGKPVGLCRSFHLSTSSLQMLPINHDALYAQALQLCLTSAWSCSAAALRAGTSSKRKAQRCSPPPRSAPNRSALLLHGHATIVTCTARSGAAEGVHSLLPPLSKCFCRSSECRAAFHKC